MMEPHMIDFVELASLGCKLYLFVFVIVVNHMGFIIYILFKMGLRMTLPRPSFICKDKDYR
jgi:hypothetical protein